VVGIRNYTNIKFHGNPSSGSQVVPFGQTDEETFMTKVIFDVRGSVHHSVIRIENPTKWNSVLKFYFIFI
jgi:hypothetical protein